eukprot:CAMPEP_0116151554 /NCGR_PEP_ID=MMETSP0329-20121206/20161_1 /TAXON_ID=697910 /ORGANISM="Pseudo-nitzschia arenysensis, Strain B593" /LENGTH=449 /DNA_ID=CAMNT_0003648179 /DNA_START=85 /DNA_END=1434 /DNA_ORIENTATION=+
MEVNKEQAEKCKTIGANALKQAQYDRAVKFFKKSLHLYPLPGVEALLATAERLANGESSSSGGAGSGSSSNYTNGASSSSSGTSSSYNGGASASAASAAPASAPAPAPSSGGRACTPAMEETVERILKAKEGGRGAHYRVLGISQNATESEIKKAYRKTAIKVHPDKNSAPKSDEAFKAVGLAYATLSDPQKRTIYDRYGEEDPDNRGGGMGGMRRGPGGVHFRPGQEVNPEDIFNMFFGGGMNGMGGGMHRGPGGVHFTTNFGGMPRGFRHQNFRGGQQQQQQQEPEAPGLANLIQLLPFLMIMLLSFFNMNNDYSASSAGGGSNRSPGLNRYFTLTSQDPFVNPLHTKLTSVKDIPYFVDNKFLRTLYRDRYQLSQVERMVERAYENYLIDECNAQRKYKKSLLAEAKTKMTEEEIQLAKRTAEKFELSRCVELNDLFPLRNAGRRY